MRSDAHPARQQPRILSLMLKTGQYKLKAKRLFAHSPGAATSHQIQGSLNALHSDCACYSRSGCFGKLFFEPVPQLKTTDDCSNQKKNETTGAHAKSYMKLTPNCIRPEWALFSSFAVSASFSSLRATSSTSRGRGVQMHSRNPDVQEC